MNDVSPPRPASPPPVSLPVAVVVIAISAPAALAFETLMRTQVLARVLGSDLADARAFFSPALTSCAWALVGATVVAGMIGVALLPASARRVEAAARKAGDEVDPATRERRALERLYLLTSIPQVPALLSTFCFTLGAQLWPVAVAMGVSTVFVLAQGVVAARLLRG